MSTLAETYMPFGLPAVGYLTFSSTLPSAGATVSVAGTTYTYGATASGPRFFGRDYLEAARSLALAINGDPGQGDAAGANRNPVGSVWAQYGGGVVSIIARVPGEGGNAIAISSATAQIVASGATLEGGTTSGSAPSSVVNVAALRLASYYDGQVLYTRGAVTPNDGNQKSYIFDATSVADDDGLSVVKPTAIDSADPGRWLVN